MMEGVEDIPGTALHEGPALGLGVVPRVPRRTRSPSRARSTSARTSRTRRLRAYVMGERGADPLAATRRNANSPRWPGFSREGLDAGALGVSTSRTERHRTSRGENLGTLRAREPELQALASVLRATGRGVFQLVSDSYRTTDDDFAASEFALIARDSLAPAGAR